MRTRTAVTSSERLADMFGLEGMVLREHLQQDKAAALYAVARMFSDFALPYVVTGGIAIQLHVAREGIRHTNDVDVVSLRDRFRELKSAEPWTKYGLELVFDRRRYVKLRHPESNVDIDVNLDTRFARLLNNPVFETIQDLSVPFTSPREIAFAKLRTQRSDWPRDEAKRLQDRADLVRLFRNHPELPEQLRNDPETTEEMQSILQEVVRITSRGHRQ